MKYRNITIQKHKTCNTWYARYRKNGKQCYVSAPTQKECYNQLKKALNAITKEIKAENKPKTYTLQEWYNKWLELFKKDRQPTTLMDYKNNFSYLNNLQKVAINDINNLDIMSEINKIPTARQKQKVYEFAKMLFKNAKQMHLIDTNPLEDIDKPNYTRKQGEAFSQKDEKEFINLCLSNNLDIFLVGLYQGLRKGEILAITNKDIDLENKTLTINKSWTLNNTFGPTKNQSDRVMPLFDKSIKILEKYKNINGRIFPLEYRKCGNIFKELTSNLEYKHYTPKALRYTFITKSQEIGIPLHIIQKWVGHKKGSTVTTKVYTKTRDTAEIYNINKLNNLLD